MNRRGLGTMAAALIALLMLSYASIQATVMQVAMASSVAGEPSRDADPGAMAGMTMPGMTAPRAGMGGAGAGASRAAHGHRHGHAKPAACPYCAAAAHLPILGGATLFRSPAIISFAAFRVVASLGPRGPPSRQPRARDPPTDPQPL